MTLFTSRRSDCCSFQFFSTSVCIHSHSPCILLPRFQTFKWKTAAMAPSRYQGAEAAGDMPEGTLLKHVFTTKAGLVSGGGKEVVAL